MRQDPLMAACAERLRSITLPVPFDLDAFCASVAAQRGRPLYVVPMPDTANADRPFGAWLRFEEADVIYYESATSPVHRTHIVFHEIAHMLCGHRAEDAPLAALFPDIAPHVLGAMFRHGYSTEAEHEAELLAALMLDQVERASETFLDSPADRRLHDVLLHPVRTRGVG